MAQEMDTLVCDALMDVGAFPEVAPPPLKGRTCLLGKYYNLPQEYQKFLSDVNSRLWMTYRRNFRAIGGTSLTSDSGWGCTLRCGQMLVAQALVIKHLGRQWRWERGKVNHRYMKILRKFLDDRDSEYSLQMIALQGADFGRPAGQWLGPNNVAQAIKKLSVHDKWTELAVHVAMDMVVVVEDIKLLCQQQFTVPGDVSVTKESGDLYSERDDLDKRMRAKSDVPPTLRHQNSCPQPIRRIPIANLPIKTPPTVDVSSEQSIGVTTAAMSRITRQRSLHDKFTKALGNKSLDTQPFLNPADFSFLDKPEVGEGHVFSSLPKNLSPKEGMDGVTGVREEVGVAGVGSVNSGSFRPLLLFIPLRLGQETFNMEYATPLKKCLSLPQSVGFIGGRPRHAQYFIGYHDDYLWYLDPHTTQPTVVPCDPHVIPDSTYHCSRADRMPMSELDPSVALGFVCRDEADIDDLCSRLKKEVLPLGGCYSMFELAEKRPSYWGPLETASFQSLREPFLLVDETDGISPQEVSPQEEDFDDEGFEIISWPVTNDHQ